MCRHLHLFAGIIFFSSQLFSQNQSRIDSLLNSLSNVDTETQFNTYLKLAGEIQPHNPDSAAEYLGKAEKLIDLEVTNEKTLDYYCALSRCRLYQHDYENSLSIAERVLKDKNLVSSDQLINLYSTIGTVYYYKSEFEKAINNHLKALKISDTLNSSHLKTGIYNNLGVVYMGVGDWQKTEEYVTQALKLAELHENSFEASRARGNMAILFAMQEKYDLAEEWFIKDLEADRSSGDPMSVSKNLNNLGRLYEMQEDLTNALINYQKGLDIATEIDDKASIALGYQNVGHIYGKLGNHEQAINYFKTGLDLTKSLGNRGVHRDGLLNISEFFESLGNINKALEYYQQYHLLNDSLISESHLKAVSELEIKYETEKKEKNILTLSQQKLKDDAALAKQKTNIRRLSLGLLATILLFGGGIVVFRQRVRNQKQKELIAAIADTQIAERKRIAQDLHDSVGGSLALAKNKLQVLFEKDRKQSKEVRESIETISKTSEHVRQISHNLMPGELVKFGLVSAIQTTLDQLQETELNAQLYAHDMKKRIDPTKEIHLYRIVQEIIQNVLKHAKAKNLNVYLNKHKKHLSLMVEDDGVGMESKALSNLGIGLNSIKTRVAYLKGTMNIDSGIGQGTTLNIQIPV